MDVPIKNNYWKYLVNVTVILASISLIACGVGSGGSTGGDPTKSSQVITAYSINGATGVIDTTAKAIALTLPFGTSVTSLVATFSITGASVTVDDVAQMSSITSNDFTSPVSYLVTAVDGSSTIYTVTVTVATSSAKALTRYSIDGVTGSSDR